MFAQLQMAAEYLVAYRKSLAGLGFCKESSPVA